MSCSWLDFERNDDDELGFRNKHRQQIDHLEILIGSNFASQFFFLLIVTSFMKINIFNLQPPPPIPQIMNKSVMCRKNDVINVVSQAQNDNNLEITYIFSAIFILTWIKSPVYD